jgi:hypothetical protein
MRKTIALILALVLALACAAMPSFADEETTVEIVTSELGFENAQDMNTITSGSVTLEFNKGTNNNPPKYYDKGSAIRFYAGNTLGISAGDGNVVTAVVITFSDTSNTGNLSFDSGESELSDVVLTWTGTDDKVVITNPTGASQARFASIKVTYKAGTVPTTEPSTPPSTEPEEPEQPELKTPEEILTKLYSLAQGETLYGGPYTLTGKITSVDIDYNDKFQNVTVTIAVEGFEDKPVQCFRMKGEGADVIKKDYVITVTGTLCDYKGTKEFKEGCTLDSYTAPAADPGTEPEQPELKTPEEILTKLYELGQGETLYGGPYTLTGKITNVDIEYSEKFQNVTVTIAVEGFEDKPVQCFRMKGEGADVIGKDYVITVTGTLCDYKGTKEFKEGCTLDSYTAPAVEPGTQPGTEPGTEPEQPELKTPEEILTKLYELGQGETLYGGPYTLTGKITAVNTIYSSRFNNVTVTIAVEGFEDKPVQCFRMVGDGVDIIDVDDTITVTGYLADYNGTKEFKENCTLDSYAHVEKEKEDVSKLTPEEILKRLYALENGAALGDVYTLTGKIISVDTAYSEQHGNITVTMVVDGYPEYPVMCYRLAGEGADGLEVYDVITVSGTFKNYNGTYEFVQGCTLDNVVKAEKPNVQTGDNVFVIGFAAIAVIAMAAVVVLKKELAV